MDNHQNYTKNSLRTLLELWEKIGRIRRVQAIYLLMLMMLASACEIFSLGALVPFLGALSAPDLISNNSFFKGHIHSSVMFDDDQVLLIFTVIFIIATLFSALTRLWLLTASSKFAYSVGSELSLEIYERVLSQSYIWHCRLNSSDAINIISNKVNAVISLLSALLTLCSSILIGFGIFALLMYVNPSVASSIFFGIGSFYFFLSLIYRYRLKGNSETISSKSTKVIKNLQEGLGGIRDILLYRNQNYYCKVFSEDDSSLRKAQASSVIIANSPRYLVEGLGMIFIALTAYYLVSKNIDAGLVVLPLLGTIALAAQRLLPLLQQSYSSWSGIQSGLDSLRDVLAFRALKLINQPVGGIHTPFKFDSAVVLENITFRYSENSPLIFKEINLTIKKGCRIGIVGKTGSGKSTLVDILMCLLMPSSGEMRIDGVTLNESNRGLWMQNVAHVPQSIYLADSSLEENIAFGVPKSLIDFDRVKLAAKQAQLVDFIENLPEGFATKVGERGVRLSGGQRQRIGIARALYRNASLIIFDEGTSALDAKTEESIMSAINNLSRELTIVLVAHRLSTLENCDQIIRVNNHALEIEYLH